jgi:hypothetical protein
LKGYIKAFRIEGAIAAYFWNNPGLPQLELDNYPEERPDKSCTAIAKAVAVQHYAAA